MTTIAFDGKTLAADRMSAMDGCKNGRVTKIRRTADGRLLGGAGWATSCVLMMDWMENGGERPAFQSDKDRSAHVVEVMPDGRVYRHEEGGRSLVESLPVTVGSGAPYAMAAMLCGKDAKGAVEIACELDESSAGPVDTLVLGVTT